jgi:putative spermidine/putrescine transport system ATP-binding protein
MLDGVVEVPGVFRTRGGLTLKSLPGPTGPSVLALRPERLTLGEAAAGLDNRVEGVVSFVSYLGAMIDLHIRLNEQDHVVVQTPNRRDSQLPTLGDQVTVGWSAEVGLIFADDK